ncbi:hypothetical protein ACFLKC_18285 (plasmid) [Clostridium caseinilyticum]
MLNILFFHLINTTFKDLISDTVASKASLGPSFFIVNIRENVAVAELL